VVKNGLDIKILMVNGFKCFVVSDKKVKPSNRRIIYIHGGAFVSEVSQIHWLYIKTLIKETKAIVYVPIYPLSNNKYSSQLDTIEFLLNLYNNITTTEPNCTYSIMGDSAGGNFALILAQQIKIKRYLKPKNLILISPVVNMEMTPEANKIAHNDPVLSYNLLTIVMKWQLQKNSPKNPLFSPVFGENKDIGDIYIFMGEREVFLYHINQYLKVLDKQGVKYFVDVKKEMYHAYPIFVVDKNAKEANKKIFEILNKDN
jgi:acetyl esterase/lipase